MFIYYLEILKYDLLNFVGLCTTEDQGVPDSKCDNRAVPYSWPGATEPLIITQGSVQTKHSPHWVALTKAFKFLFKDHKDLEF